MGLLATRLVGGFLGRVVPLINSAPCPVPPIDSSCRSGFTRFEQRTSVHYWIRFRCQVPHCTKDMILSVASYFSGWLWSIVVTLLSMAAHGTRFDTIGASPPGAQVSSPSFR